MGSLSKREKSLLFLLSLIVIFGVGIVLWILPLSDSVSSLTAERDLLSQQETDMRNKIMSIRKLNENKDTLIKDVTELMDTLSDPLVTENFDVLTQELAKVRDLKIQSLKIGSIETVAPSALETPSRQYEYNLMSLIDVYRNYNLDDEKNLTTEHEILKQSITLELNGSYDKVRAFISDLNNSSKTIFIKSVNYDHTTTTSLDDLGLENTTSNEETVLNLDIYFIEKLYTNGHLDTK